MNNLFLIVITEIFAVFIAFCLIYGAIVYVPDMPKSHRVLYTITSVLTLILIGALEYVILTKLS